MNVYKPLFLFPSSDVFIGRWIFHDHSIAKNIHHHPSCPCSCKHACKTSLFELAETKLHQCWDVDEKIIDRIEFIERARNHFPPGAETDKSRQMTYKSRGRSMAEVIIVSEIKAMYVQFACPGSHKIYLISSGCYIRWLSYRFCRSSMHRQLFSRPTGNGTTKATALGSIVWSWGKWSDRSRLSRFTCKFATQR